MPPGEVDESPVGKEVAQSISESGKEDTSDESVVFHGVVAAHELVCARAVEGTLSGGVAEGLTSKVDVSICISSDDIEKESTAAFLFADGANFSATGVAVAGEKLEYEGGEF